MWWGTQPTGAENTQPPSLPTFDTPTALPFGQSHLKVNSKDARGTALRCQLLRSVVELRSVARGGWGGKDVSGTVKNTQHSGVTCTFPNIQWMGIKELLENINCYLAAKIVVTHFQLNHLGHVTILRSQK